MIFLTSSEPNKTVIIVFYSGSDCFTEHLVYHALEAVADFKAAFKWASHCILSRAFQLQPPCSGSFLSQLCLGFWFHWGLLSLAPFGVTSSPGNNLLGRISSDQPFHWNSTAGSPDWVTFVLLRSGWWGAGTSCCSFSSPLVLYVCGSCHPGCLRNSGDTIASTVLFCFRACLTWSESRHPNLLRCPDPLVIVITSQLFSSKEKYNILSWLFFIQSGWRVWKVMKSVLTH